MTWPFPPSSSVNWARLRPGHLPGVFKLVADRASGKLLGAHLAGAHATDLIAETALALQMGASVQDIAHTIHAHPTLAEGVFEAAHMF